ncbi:MAG: hydroxymethylglutaryl-CoA synthase, partial [Verrucomicrobia bacterium]|nr:hydroxymethylglutaryl-CoA synthase [Verrucomicrobiota bacterium]
NPNRRPSICMDFWRPNYRETACVDGHYSIRVYLRALAESWQTYRAAGGADFAEHDHYCYHLPFTRMASKAHRRLAEIAGDEPLSDALRDEKLAHGLLYNRQIGNTYTASLYVSLLSLLETSECSLAGSRIALFSYGSGCMGAFFSGTVVPGYQRQLHVAAHRHMLENRRALTLAEYESMQAFSLPQDGSPVRIPALDVARFCFAGLDAHKRIYQACPGHALWGHAAT